MLQFFPRCVIISLDCAFLLEEEHLLDLMWQLLHEPHQATWPRLIIWNGIMADFFRSLYGFWNLINSFERYNVSKWKIKYGIIYLTNRYWYKCFKCWSTSSISKMYRLWSAVYTSGAPSFSHHYTTPILISSKSFRNANK